MRNPFVQRLFASFIAALVASLAAIGAVAMAYMIGSQVKVDVIPTVVDLFLPASGILLVLVWAAGLLRLLDNRWLALITGVVTGIVSVILGLVLKLAAIAPTFQPFSAEGWPTIAPMLLIFSVSATIVVLTLGVWVNRSLLRVLGKRRGGPVALVRVPADNLAEGLVTHISRKKINAEKADSQWDAYVATLQSEGFDICEVEPRMDLADSVFVEDTVVMFGETAVLASPGADSRRDEVPGTERALRRLGVTLKRIMEPGTLDGGDVLKIGSTVYVGRGGRTNAEGIRQLRSLITPLGYTVIAVPMTKALHLKSAVTALPDGTVIGFAKLVDNPSVFDRFLPVPEPEGVAVVVVADDAVIMSSSAPKSIEIVRELGYRVIPVDISEFEKLEGCVTCLSVRVR